MLTIIIEIICDNTKVPHFSLSYGLNWAQLTIFISTATMTSSAVNEFLAICCSHAKVMLSSIGITGGSVDKISVSGPSSPLDTSILSTTLQSIWMSPVAEALPVTSANDALAKIVLTHIQKYGNSPNFNLVDSKNRQKVYNYIRSATGSQDISESNLEYIRRQILIEQ